MKPKHRRLKQQVRSLERAIEDMIAKHEADFRLLWDAVGPGVNGYLPDVIRALREERDRLREMVSK
jgi:hypothetical protein